MNLNRILIPVDFSEASHALSVATVLARDTGAELLIVHVNEPTVYGDGEVHLDLLRESRKALEAMLAEIQPTDPQVPFRHILVEGDPAREILATAKDEKADLIVMSTHGRTGLMRLLMGSVAEAVVRRADCPVLTCKQAQPAHAEAGADADVSLAH